ncbi:Gamma-glutamyl phosphate reductase [subsurface metagenome]
MSVKDYVLKKAKEAKKASRKLASLSGEVKNRALTEMARELLKNSPRIIKENRKDINLARDKRLSTAFIDRLTLNSSRISQMARGLEEVTNLPDPVGKIIKKWRRPNGLKISKVRVPLGVIGIIYESRPNVTVDAAGLCLKSGNSVILRGGSEAINSNIILANLLSRAAQKTGVPQGSIQLIETTERKAVGAMLALSEYINLIIPRGGEELIRRVTEDSKIPVIMHYKGLCHIYVDKDADLEMAQKICYNAKVQRPGVCNAMETLLVHKDISRAFLPPMVKKFKKAGVEIRGCERTRKIFPRAKRARKKDWETEYLDLILSIKTVSNFKSAVEHIDKYSSQLSEAIISENYSTARKFLQEVDSACVYVNASTRFTDGNQFGLGAEIGISTQKLHARGPVALEELTTYKYIVFGEGQIRE